MNFSKEWAEQYKARKHMSIWPWSDLISYVKRFAGKNSKVLELGFGVGANIPFFLDEGFDYTGIDGSAEAVDYSRQRFPHISGSLYVGDFTTEIPSGPFDIIIDRAALTHNSTKSIALCIEKIKHELKPDGLFFGIDWFSTNNEEFHRGLPGSDPMTRTGYTEGSFAGVGEVHFSNEEHLKLLFDGWEWLSLEEKIVSRFRPQPKYQYATWSFVVRNILTK